MDRPAWLSAKAIGDQGEEAVVAAFAALGLHVKRMDGLGPFDVLVRGTVESKRDRRAVETGHVAVEVGYRNRPSGIATTTASCWCVTTDHETLCLPVAELRSLIASHDYRTVPAGENGRVVLVPLRDLRRVARRVSP
jgi:hypothetical protein